MSSEHWYLNILQDGIGQANESQTSLYLQRVLQECLRWPIENMEAQVGKRGVIDYELTFPNSTVRLQVEVKKHGSPLKDSQIKKYLVRSGPETEEFRVGVLTNLSEWQIYVAGSGVQAASGERMIRVKGVTIRGRSNIAEIFELIGYRSNGRLKNLRASLGESSSVLRHLISNDEQVVKAVRQQLTDLKDRRQIDARVPQNDSLRRWISEVLNGNSAKYSSWTSAKLKQALRSWSVVEVVNRRLTDLCGSRSRQSKVRRTINQILKECSEGRLKKAA